ncbi:MAG: response regulator transcription factor [Candidatus Korobacteraceae bacterium]
MKQPKNTIRIAVVETDPLRFLGLRAIFSSEEDFKIRASTIPSILSSPDDDIILMTSSGGAAFYAAMSALKAVRPAIRIIVTGTGADDEEILRAIAAGAKGYIGAAATPEQFKQAIRVVHSGSVWAPRRVLCTFIERATASPRRILTQGEDKISEREREVLKLLVAGRSNKEIGDELGIEERTVKAHVGQLMRKVGVQNRIALSVHAITHSLCSSPQ